MNVNKTENKHTSRNTSNVDLPINANNTLDKMAMLKNQLCGGVLLILGITGLLFYMVFIVVVLARKKFKHSPFFIIAAWLGIADCLTLIVIITCAAPSVILNKDFINRNTIPGGVLNIAWFTSLPLILLLAFNRYLCICRTELSKRVYTRKKSYYYCLASWCFGLAYSIASFFDCCPLYFEYKLMSWQWDVAQYGAKILSHGELIMVMFVTVGAFTCNGFVIRTLHLSHNSNTSLSTTQENRRLARERKIFIQFFITNIWLVIFDIPFITMAYFEEPSHWLGYFVTITYIINCSINGYVYLLLNRTIRKEIRDWAHDLTGWKNIFCCNKTSDSPNQHGCTDSDINLSQIRVTAVDGATPRREVKL